MYLWRRLSDEARMEIMRARIHRGGTWRRPPVWKNNCRARYLLTAACYEHAEIIGQSIERMSMFEDALLSALSETCEYIIAHSILPNHYHALVISDDIAGVRSGLGRLHGRCSRMWNLQDDSTGRKVFHGSAETLQKSDRHFRASMNYVHHNPVRHGYVARWQDWPWSSASDYLECVGETEAKRQWLEYPIDRYGEDWDH
jgi:putative transposase